MKKKAALIAMILICGTAQAYDYDIQEKYALDLALDQARSDGICEAAGVVADQIARQPTHQRALKLALNPSGPDILRDIMSAAVGFGLYNPGNPSIASNKAVAACYNKLAAVINRRMASIISEKSRSK